MPLFLFAISVITLGAYANDGGHEYVEQYGAKAYVQKLVDERQPVDYNKMNK